MPKKYKKGNDQEDFAILILQDHLGDKCGYFGIREFPKDLKSEIHIYGYPGDKVKKQITGEYFKYLYGMKGEFLFSNELITYNKIDTNCGQSGSPICIEAENRERYIIGVHVRAQQGYNEGTYLNKARIDKIRKWVIN